MKVNLPTQLTLLRLALTPFLLICMVVDHTSTRIAALLIFGAASITDYYDGQLARKLGMETTLGKFLDPLADKLLISTALIAMVQIPDFYVPAWMVVLIIGREFMITGLRTLAIHKGVVLPAQRAGKFKTTSQISSILLILIIMVVNSVLEEFYGIPRGGSWDGQDGVMGALGWFLKNGPYWLIAITTFFTILSGYIYLSDHKDLFINE